MAVVGLRPAAVSYVLPLAFLAAGIAWACYQGQQLVAQQLPPQLERKTLSVTGVVEGLPQRNLDRVRVDLRIERASLHNVDVEIPSRIRLSAYQTEWAPRAGQRWQLKVRLRRPHGFQNPGGFDYEAHLFSHRIRATGYLVEHQPRILLGQPIYSGVIDRLRDSIAHRLDHALGPDPQVGILRALAIGDRQRIRPTQWNVLQHTGTSHLVAISGLHLSLVSGLVFLLTQWLWRRFEFGCLRWPAPKAAALAGLLFASAYAALAGFSIPTQRALVMLFVAYLGVMTAKQPNRPRIIATALLAVLLFDPLSVLNPGFWLSFTAVGIILYMSSGRMTTGRMLDGVRIQWAISLGLIPLTLLFFQSASIVSPIANLLAIPVFTLLVVPTTLLGVITMPIEAISNTFLILASAFTSLGWQWVTWLNHLTPTVLHAPSPGLIALVCSLIGLAIMGLPSGMPARWLGLVWCLPLFWLPPRPAAGTFQLTLLDVGQGLSVVVRTASHSLLFDTGARFSSDFDAGGAVVVPFLRAQGVHVLDTVIISHGDNDHIGGYQTISKNIPVRRLVSNVTGPRLADNCRVGEAWQWDGVRFSILHPDENQYTKNNNASCVLHISSKSGSALLAADIEKQVERLLLHRYGKTLGSDLLIAPHHGSATSSSETFLRAANPQWILIPAGHLNRYRHPAKKVVQRYNKYQIPWRVSGTSGAIEFTFNGAPLSPKLYRDQYRRYWHSRFEPMQTAP